MLTSNSLANRSRLLPLLVVAALAAPALTQTAPALTNHYAGPNRTNGGGYFVPSTGAGVGPTKIFITVNSSLTEYQRSPFVALNSASLANFFGSLQLPFSPRVLYDQHSGRWFVTASALNGSVSVLLLAVSSTSSPTLTSGWFKTAIVISSGTDTGYFADNPTLGVDARGLYATFNMFPSGAGSPKSTIVAIDKAPLVAAIQTLGAVSPFRDLPFESLMQPCHTWGDPGVEYVISTPNSSSLLIRAVQPPLTAPTLVTIGSVPVTAFSNPANASALGSPFNVKLIDARLLNAVYRNGSIWTTHHIDVSSNSAVRWYEVDLTSLAAPLQTGTISSVTRDYYFPSLAVNAFDDVVLGFSGSSPTEYIGAYYTGRLASDAPGATAPAAQIIVAPFTWNVPVGSAAAWGFYSATCADANDPHELWTFQEHTSGFNAWTIRAAQLRFADPAPSGYCTSKTNSAGCTPAITSSGTPDVSGASDFTIRCQNILMNKSGLLFYGFFPTAAPFQGGWFCTQPPTRRTPVQNSPSGAAECGPTIQYSYDFDARIRAGVDPALASGQRVYAQWWMRDPASPSTTGLSNGLLFGIGP